MIEHFLTTTIRDGHILAGVARHDMSAGLVTVGTPDGASKSTQAGGSHPSEVAKLLHRELLAQECETRTTPAALHVGHARKAAEFVKGQGTAEVALAIVRGGQADPNLLADLVETITPGERRGLMRYIQKSLERAHAIAA